MARKHRLAELSFLLATLLALAGANAAGPSRSATTIYCCEDASGRRVCGDILPSTCYGTGYREISPRGTVRREEPPPLSAEEIARRQREEKLQTELEARQLKQRRLDSALLETYTSLADLESRRDRALGHLERAIAVEREREANLQGRRGELEDERSKRKKPSPALEEEFRAVDGDLKTIGEVISAKVREYEALRVKYEQDRRRYVELTGTADARP